MNPDLSKTDKYLTRKSKGFAKNKREIIKTNCELNGYCFLWLIFKRAKMINPKNRNTIPKTTATKISSVAPIFNIFTP